MQAPAEFGFGGRVEENPLGSDRVEDSSNCLWKFRSCAGPLAYECLCSCEGGYELQGQFSSQRAVKV